MMLWKKTIGGYSGWNPVGDDNDAVRVDAGCHQMAGGARILFQSIPRRNPDEILH